MTVHPDPDQHGALAHIRNDLGRVELAPDLRESVSHHYQHLETLTKSLRTLGVDNEVIDQHVTEIFNKYKAELLRNIERME